MAAGLVVCASEGKRGLLGYVDSSNYASLRSCRRLGYRTVGLIVMLKIGSQYVASATSGCRQYGFRVEQGVDPTS